MSGSALAVLAAAGAGWLLTAPAPPALQSRVAPDSRRFGANPEVVGAGVGLVAAAALLGSLVATAAGTAAGAAAVRAARAHRAHAAREAVRARLPDVLRLLSAELIAGAPPPRALESAAEGAPGVLADHLRRAAAEVRLGGEPARALRHPPHGADGLAALAACWEVSAATGASLGSGTARLAAGLAAEGRCRAEVEAQLAGPRSSAAVLAGLPLLAALMGAGLGAAPWAFFRTPAGSLCLTGGLALNAAGLVWTSRIARAAQP